MSQVLSFHTVACILTENHKNRGRTSRTFCAFMASVIALHLLNLRLFATFRLGTSRHLARLLWIKPASVSGKQICGAETSAPLGICSSKDSARAGALLLTLRGFLVAEQMLNHSSGHRSCGTRGVQGGHKAPGGVQGHGRQAHRRGHRMQQRHARPHRTGTCAAGLTDHRNVFSWLSVRSIDLWSWRHVRFRFLCLPSLRLPSVNS